MQDHIAVIEPPRPMILRWPDTTIRRVHLPHTDPRHHILYLMGTRSRVRCQSLRYQSQGRHRQNQTMENRHFGPPCTSQPHPSKSLRAGKSPAPRGPIARRQPARSVMVQPGTLPRDRNRPQSQSRSLVAGQYGLGGGPRRKQTTNRKMDGDVLASRIQSGGALSVSSHRKCATL